MRIDSSVGAGPFRAEIGDIVIVFGIGVTSILYVARITRRAFAADEQERRTWRIDYPWSILGENLYPNFGFNWHRYKLSPFQLVKDFHRIAPLSAVTHVGGRTLGAINHHSDRIKLSDDFAMFVIGHVHGLDGI